MYDCVNVRVRVYVIRVYVPYRTHRTLCYTTYVQFRLVYLFTVAVIFVFPSSILEGTVNKKMSVHKSTRLTPLYR